MSEDEIRMPGGRQSHHPIQRDAPSRVAAEYATGRPDRLWARRRERRSPYQERDFLQLHHFVRDRGGLVMGDLFGRRDLQRGPGSPGPRDRDAGLPGQPDDVLSGSLYQGRREVHDHWQVGPPRDVLDAGAQHPGRHPVQIERRPPCRLYDEPDRLRLLSSVLEGAALAL